jgi:hypothetical protein
LEDASDGPRAFDEEKPVISAQPSAKQAGDIDMNVGYQYYSDIIVYIWQSTHRQRHVLKRW